MAGVDSRRFQRPAANRGIVKKERPQRPFPRTEKERPSRSCPWQKNGTGKDHRDAVGKEHHFPHPGNGEVTLKQLLFVAAHSRPLLAQGNLVETADLQSIIELKDRAASIFQEEKPQPDISPNMNLSENLFGNPSLAVLNENKLPLVLSPGTGAGSIPTNTKPVERVFQQSQAGEAAAVPSELYIESLPPENREIIKNYFTLLSQSD